jgi:lysophospholipase L1-like esterase
VQRYAALGDSYASGEGLAPFEAGGGACNRSPAAYPRLVAAAEGATVAFVACTGATVPDLDGQIGAAVTAATDLVTVTIGGNDAGFASVVRECLIGPDPCSVLDAEVSASLATLGPVLESAYRRIRRAAPSATLVVVGYPQVVGDPAQVDVDACPAVATPVPGLRVTAVEARWLREKGARLSAVVRAAAAAAGARYVDAQAAFAGHEACTGDPWLAGVVLGDARASFHPTGRGQAELASLVGRALR